MINVGLIMADILDADNKGVSFRIYRNLLDANAPVTFHYRLLLATAPLCKPLRQKESDKAEQCAWKTVMRSH
jgi:HKD family nuclease